MNRTTLPRLATSLCALALAASAFAGGADASPYAAMDEGPGLEEHYARHGQRFEFENDNHWNALGHEIVSRSIQDSGLIDRVLAAKDDGDGRLASAPSSR